MPALNLFPARVRFVNQDGTLTSEAFRAFQEIVNRTGGVLGNVGNDTFVPESAGGIEAQQIASGDVYGAQEWQALDEMLTQVASTDNIEEMVMQPPEVKAAIAVDAASTDLPTVIALCNQLRAALISNNITI